MMDWCGEYSHLRAEWIAQQCETSERTAYRWKKRGPPRLARVLIDFVGGGLLDVLRPGWRGWRLHDDALVSPDGRRFTQAELMRLTWLQEIEKDQRIELAQLRAAAYPDCGAYKLISDGGEPSLP